MSGYNKLTKEDFESKSHETHFPIMNKIDRAWELSPKLTFCELFWNIIPIDLIGKNMKDLKFSKLLDDYIEKYSNDSK